MLHTFTYTYAYIYLFLFTLNFYSTKSSQDVGILRVSLLLNDKFIDTSDRDRER